MDSGSKFGSFETNVITESGNVYKNVQINDDPNHEIIKVTDKPTCKAPGPIACSYVEKHFADLLYCQLTNGEMHTYKLGNFKKLGDIVIKPETTFVSMSLRSNKNNIKFLLQQGRSLQMYEVSRSLDVSKKNSYNLPELPEKVPLAMQKVHSAVIDKTTSKLIAIDKAYIYVQENEDSKEL